MGNFNAECADTIVSDFYEIHNPKNIIRKKNCFKNPKFQNFQNAVVIETGLSYFHKMFITVMKMYYSKQKPIIHYRKFKDFNNDSFIKDLQTFLTKSFNKEAIPFQALRGSVNVTLEKHEPTKKRYARANQAPYMNKSTVNILIYCAPKIIIFKGAHHN